MTTTTTSTSVLPTTGETIRDLLPTIELTPRVVEALDDENWRLGADDPSELAAGPPSPGRWWCGSVPLTRGGWPRSVPPGPPGPPSSRHASRSQRR